LVLGFEAHDDNINRTVIGSSKGVVDSCLNPA
jgi:hypothetical protein